MWHLKIDLAYSNITSTFAATAICCNSYGEIVTVFYILLLFVLVGKADYLT